MPLCEPLLPHVGDQIPVRVDLLRGPKRAGSWSQLARFDPVADHPHALGRRAMSHEPLALVLGARHGRVCAVAETQ